MSLIKRLEEAKEQPAELYFIVAECFIDCDDPGCPYTHVSGWFNGDDGPYETRAAALKARGAE